MFLEVRVIRASFPGSPNVVSSSHDNFRGRVLWIVLLCLQVTLAVLVSGWAHVLHAMFKPWGAGSVMYVLQHGSLFVTSFVFLMVR